MSASLEDIEIKTLPGSSSQKGRLKFAIDHEKQRLLRHFVGEIRLR